MKKTSFSAVSLFSGCGGSDLGLAASGIETIWSNDIDKAACELYPRIVGRDVIHQGDIKNYRRIPKADILVGCYPCQGYSQAGKRQPDRSINYLYREFDRVLRQVRPKAFIVENVYGMRFSQNEGLFRNQITRFRMAGYKVSWQVLDAKEYGLAQDRKRLIIVGIKSSKKKAFEFPASKFGADKIAYRTLRDVIWEYRDAPEGSYNTEPFHWYYLSRNRRRGWNEQAPCIVAHWRHLGLHPDSPPLRRVCEDKWEFEFKGIARRYSYIECAALQGFPRPEAFDYGPVSARFRAIGNAVPPPLFEGVADALVQQIS